MTINKLLTIVVGFLLVLAACTNNAGATTTTTSIAETSTSTAPAPTTTTTTTADQATTTTRQVMNRPLEVVDCQSDEEIPEEVVIVCEAFDLVLEEYVDPIEPAMLAEAASLGLQTLDGNDSEELLVCATPDETFISVCDTAAIAADDTAEAAEAMVAGLVAYALDPNSAYLDPASLDLIQEEQQGEIQGIGALVSPEDQTIPGDNKQCGVVSATCQVLIVSTIPGAPAEAAGLMRDDVLIAVDGESIIDWTVEEVTSAVRGPAGTDVTLTIERDGEQLEVPITRAEVVIPVIQTETIGDVGYVRLTSFGGNAGDQFEEAVIERLSDGVDELVIDLRDNPGGFLTTAVDVASVFLEDGEVLITEGPDESKDYPVNGGAIVPEDVEVTFVVNKGSASASEVVAALLQERDRAVIVGENTFGKNTVQQRFSLSNEGALKLTIARWLTPGGLDFGGTGVTPDVELDVTDLTPEELVAAVTGL